MTARPGRAATVWLVAVLVGLFLSPASASADSAYRYWAFYVASGSSWTFSQRGPASEYPVDGEVQGWRFAVQTEAADGLPPRAAPDFGSLCASTSPVTGMLRVGVIFDFGTAADAPPHETPPSSVVRGCVHIKDGATGADVLDEAASIRLGTGSDAGLVCAIDGYPATECAPAVAVAAPPHVTVAAKPTVAAVTPTTQPPTQSVPAASASASASASAPPSAPPSDAATSVLPSDPAISAPASSQPPVPNTTLTALRPKHRSNDVPLTAGIGIAILVFLTAGAAWQAKSGRR